MCSSKKISAIFISVIIFITLIPFKVSSFARGDANSDGKVNIRDASYIAKCLTLKMTLNDAADYNVDGKKNIRDAAALVNDIVGVSSDSSSSSSSSNTSVAYDERALKILDLMNKERAKVGAMPLSLNDSLIKAANIRAVEIQSLFSHERPDGSGCFTVLDQNNIAYSYCGENIAAGVSTPTSVFKLWKNSEGHYTNMINSNFTQVGIGYYYSPDTYYKYYWVQIFSAP